MNAWITKSKDRYKGIFVAMAFDDILVDESLQHELACKVVPVRSGLPIVTKTSACSCELDEYW